MRFTIANKKGVEILKNDNNMNINWKLNNKLVKKYKTVNNQYIRVVKSK